MILELIVSLGINVVLSQDIKQDCGNGMISGCYSPSRETIYYIKEESEHTLAHELGHAIFYDDDVALRVIDCYRPTENYIWYSINGYDYRQEMIADAFAEYMLDPSYSLTHPSLYIYFRDKLINN